jgi:peroxiredoxin
VVRKIQTHLPGYEAKYEEIKACGVDEIFCLSVNDAFVMRQWGVSFSRMQACFLLLLPTAR